MRNTRYLRVLENKNEIFFEKTTEVLDQNLKSKFSIRVVFSGSESYVIGNRKIKLYPGSFLVINEGTVYSRIINSSVPVNSFSAIFDPEYLDNFVSSMKSKTGEEVLMPYRAGSSQESILIDSIYSLYGDMEYNIMHLKKHADTGLTDQVMINRYLNHILLNYCTIYNQELHSKTGSLNMSAKNATKLDIVRRVAMAKDFMISHHDKHITLDDVSGIACLSVSHLIRIFRLVFNKSPYQFLTQVRLERSKYYLKNTTISIQEIVGLVGFESPSSFIRLFKTAYKITPGVFRQHSLN